MFSVAATMAVTLIFGLSLPIAFMAEMTEAPPAMSPFIAPMLLAGLMLMPPLSKVIPFPRSPRLLASSSGSPR